MPGIMTGTQSRSGSPSFVELAPSLLERSASKDATSKKNKDQVFILNKLSFIIPLVYGIIKSK
jgi:hypothetical protein